jgi:hypothetical protein
MNHLLPKLIAALCFTLTLRAAPQYQMHLEPREAYIGDPISLTLELQFSDKIELKAPPIARDSKLGNFIVLKSSLKTERSRNDDYKNIYLYEISVFDTGFQALPPLTIMWRDSSNADENWQSLKTDSQFVYIHSALAALDEITEIYAPSRISVLTPKEWSILAALFFVIGALLFYGLRSRKKAPLKKYVPPPLSPEAEAQKALRELAEKKLPLKGEYKDFYVELTFILKRYLERSYYIHILELSTTELLPLLEETVSHQAFLTMKSLLQGADLVKFAAQQSSIERCDEDFTLVERLILETAQESSDESSGKN